MREELLACPQIAPTGRAGRGQKHRQPVATNRVMERSIAEQAVRQHESWPYL